MKISVDIKMPTGELVSLEALTAINEGLLKTLNGLDHLTQFIEAFKVTFAKLNYKNPGPVIKVYFKGPMRDSCAHETDFRFICDVLSESSQPTAEEIFEHFTSEGSNLRRVMEEYLFKCKEKVKEAGDLLGDI